MNNKRELICICCPRGCHLSIDLDSHKVTGNSCPRGEAYAISEVTHPTRIITSTVVIKNAIHKRLPVKTSEPISKDKIFDVMKELNKIVVSSPVKIGDIIIKNVADTGSDIIATKNM